MAVFLPDELYVTNIPGDTTEAEISSFFNDNVRDYVVVSKRREANVSQAALVRMTGHEAALQAKAMGRVEFKGRYLHIRWSHTQRVLWVSYLHESITNEVLQAAFSQFGTVTKAVVVADAQTLATKCYGFIAFESKKDAARALQRCTESPFLIGQAVKPVKVEWARLQDTDLGFSEEIRTGKSSVDLDISPQDVSKFVHNGSRDFLLAVRLAELDVEYQRMKNAMRGRMSSLQDMLVATGHAPPLATALAADPLFAAIGAAAGAPPQPGGGGLPGPQQPPHAQAPQMAMGPPPGYQLQPPPQQQQQQHYLAPPPQLMGYAAPPGHYAAMPPPGGVKREPEFHQVPPPKRNDMRVKDPYFERFNPELSARAHSSHHEGAAPGQAPPPQQQPQPAPAVKPGGLSFVKGGQLHTALPGEGATVLPAGNGQLVDAKPAAASNPLQDFATAEAPGAKPPDHRGIGFQGASPPPAAPQQYTLGGMQPPQRLSPAPGYGPPPPAAPQGGYAGAPHGQAAPPLNHGQPGAPPPQYYAPPPQQQQQQPVQYAPPPQQYQQQAPPPAYQQPQQYAPPPQQYAPPPQQYAPPAPQYAPPPQQYAPPPQQLQQQYAPPPQQYAPPPQQYAPPPEQAAGPPPMSGYGPPGQGHHY